MVNITKNFTINEMQCPCCGKCDMDEIFNGKVNKKDY